MLTANPEPFADFFDVILLGDAEVMVPSFIEAWATAKHGKTRLDCLKLLAQTPGIYVPSLYEISYVGESIGPIKAIRPIYDSAPETVAKQVFTAADDYAAHTQILSSATTWSDTFLIEVVRSCPQECRFCLASFLTSTLFAPPLLTPLMEKVNTLPSGTQNGWACLGRPLPSTQSFISWPSAF